MRLITLFESNDTVWYHGSPEGQKLSGGFEQRTLSVRYLTDYKQWLALQDQMNQVERGSEEYMQLIDQANELSAYKTIPAPIFFSDNYSVANTYADDSKAFDYQNAEPKVFKVSIQADKILSVYAGGQNFRGIDMARTKRALSNAGVDDASIEEVFGQFIQSIRGDGSKLSTDSLATIAYDLGFDTIDVQGVKDTYMGGGPNATVRMVFDPKRITIL